MIILIVSGKAPFPGRAVEAIPVGSDADVLFRATDGDLGETEPLSLLENLRTLDIVVMQIFTEEVGGVGAFGTTEASIHRIIGAIIDAGFGGAEPVDGAIGIDPKGDGFRSGGVVAFDDLENGAVGVLVVFLTRNHDDGAGDSRDGGGANEALCRATGATGFADAHGAEERDAGGSGKIRERAKRCSNLAFAATIGAAKQGTERVDDDEADMVILNDPTQVIDTVAKIETCGVENEDAIGIDVVGIEPGPDDASWIILGGEDEDVGGDGCGAVRECRAAGKSGDEGGDDGGFAIADVAAEDGEHPGGDPAAPEPREVLGGNLGEAGDDGDVGDILLDLVDVGADLGGEHIGEVFEVHEAESFPGMRM